MPTITTYYCSRCHKEITGIGEKSGRMDYCPHCGIFLKGMNKRHVDDLTLLYVVAICLAVLSVIAMVAAPVTIIFAIGFGIWAYNLHKKLQKAKGTTPYNERKPSELTYTSAPNKSKTVAVLLAVFLFFWTWLYTYKIDYQKFWINFGLTFISIGFWLPIAWIWAIVSTTRRPGEFYENFN